MSLSVLVHSASNLGDQKQDNLKFLTVVTLEGHEKRPTKVNNNTPTKDNPTPDPIWDKKLTWNVPDGIDLSKSLQVEVYRHEKSGNDKILGSASIPLKNVINSGEQSHTLTGPGEDGAELNATIELEVTYNAPGGSGLKQKQLPSNQPTDFQVRVHVLEARKLFGNGSLNPVVKVTCGKEVQHTSTQKGTINPIFDEMLFFNFQESPDEMFDRVTEFKVLNAKKVLSDALIGSFRFDLGLVYKERDHCFIHKWLLLSDPNDSSGEAKGYLKISIQVLGPWDDPKPSPSLTEADQGSIESDIESNLLRPSGVRLTPATLIVRIFSAEDLPPMDPKAFHRKKQSARVDPYCTVSFSGYKCQTPVIWEKSDPQWNQQINLGVKFPTMSERIKLQLMDKDMANPDDFIGTCYLHMSQISALGENGFLPTFGPCFINCYGSPREYSDLPDEYDHLNKGLIEGVAYRGRVMVEVGMTLDQLPKTKTEKMSKVPVLHKDAKYKLFGAFFSATMDKNYSHRNVEFEISIGTNDYAQQSASKSELDSGDHYYSLKWEGQSEIQIDSQWEDCCQYRIECLNIILHCIDILREGMDSLKKMMRFKEYDIKAAKQQVYTVLESFEEILSQDRGEDQPLPPLPDGKKGKHAAKPGIQVGGLDQEDSSHPKKGEKDGTKKTKGSSSAQKKTKVTDIKARADSEDITALSEKVIQVTELDKHIRKLRVQELEALRTDCKLMPIHQMMVKIEEYIEQLNRMAKVDGHVDNASCHSGYLKFIQDAGDNLNKDLGSAVKNSDKNTLEEKLASFHAEVLKPLPDLSLGSTDGNQPTQHSQFDVLTREHKVQQWEALRGDCKNMSAQLLLQTIEEVEEFIDRLERIANEPQNSVPDVIIWMKSEGKRVAVKRIPSHELMYSTVQSGKNCGKLMTIYLTPPAAKKEKETMKLKDRVQLRLLLWMGLKEGNYKDEWKRCLETAKRSQSYYLRAYLYQARDMYASDRSGLSDPYAVVSFDCYSKKSRVVEQSLCPKWDETLIFDKKIEVFGDTTQSLPCVVVDFFDKDKLGKDEFLGSSIVVPSIRQNSSQSAPSSKPPKLDWIEIVRYNKPAGEVLAAFELLQEEPPEPPDAERPFTHKIVPKDIAPKLQKTTIEVLCLGVRDMQKFQLLPVDSPLVEVECGGATERSQHIKDTKKNPNFPQSVFRFDVELPGPEDRLYYPPLSIQMFDKRTFSRLSLVGTHVIKSIDQFIVKDSDTSTQSDSSPQMGSSPSPTEHIAVNMDGEDDDIEQVDTGHTEGDEEGSTRSDKIPDINIEERKAKLEEALDSDPDSRDKSDFDWWSKYYYSIGDARRTQKSYVEKGYDRMVIYPGELEAAFNGFTDVAQMFPLYRGKGSKDKKGKSGEPVGYFKGSFKVYSQSTPSPMKCPKLPSTDPVEVIVRVYVIKGIDLQPRDPDGKSDPYIKMKFGNKTIIDDKDNYIPSNLNPIFGKMFEFPATLPLDHTLTVSVMDWDRLSADDLIGETKIDLENRFLSQHRATCGLPESFSKRGPNRWRDSFLPKDALDDWITAKCLRPAEWAWDQESKRPISVTVNGHTYKQSDCDANKTKEDPYLSEMSDQRLALYALRQQNLVPEHIETRNLYAPMHPGISQGQLHMWVDMFKKSDGIPPPPVDVSPRKPEKYVLRVVVWNTKDVILNEHSPVAGDSMSDIYVKGWLRGGDDTQKTDVHYRSMNGEGNFNWRFVFPLEYLPTEKVMVIKKKEHFYNLTKAEKRLPPILTMQIWDNDLFTPNDFLGTIDLNLSSMPPPEKRSRNCSPSQLSKDKHTDLFKRKRIGEHTDLFKRKCIGGWWPAIDTKNTKKDKPKLTGKLELEFEILTEEEANLRPAAKGREEPNQNPKLDPPNRPKTSFLWFTSPWNSFKYIIWKEHKCKIIWAIIAILCLIPIIAVLL